MPIRGPNNYGDIITQLADLKSTTGEINNMGSLKSQFDIQPNLVGNIFGARKRQLAQSRGRALSSASARMSTRSATPETTFGGIESGFADAFSGLEGAQGQAELDQEQSLTQLLYSILQGNNQFNLGKNAMQSSAMGGWNQQQQYEEQKPGLLDDLMSIFNANIQAGKKVAGAMGAGG